MGVSFYNHVSTNFIFNTYFYCIESKSQDANQNDDLLLMGGIDLKIDKQSSFSFEPGVSDTEHNNGVS